ncbi:MAG: hypothetical protein R3C44_12910 [Chloroflexota bacterium]
MTKTLNLTSFRLIIGTGLLFFFALGMAGCNSDDMATDNPTPAVQTPVVESNPAAPDQTTTGTSGIYPNDLRTGITGLDPVLEALAGGDPERIADRFQTLETPCTTADGLGGPPKCEDGVTDGTVVTVFPVLGSEGSFVPAQGILTVVENMDIGGLFGIYQVTSEPTAEEAYWPSGDYGVVLTGSGSVPAYTLLVADGEIVRLIYHLDVGPEQAFDNGRGAILLPPLQ